MKKILSLETWIKSRIDHRFSFKKSRRYEAAQLRQNQAWLNSAAQEQLCIENVEPISEMLEVAHKTGRPIYLTTAHWGAYFESLVALAATFPPKSKFAVIRGRNWSDIDEEALWCSINRSSSKSVRVFQRSELNAVALYRYMRSGANGIFLYDLDRSYGREIEVSFFGQKLTLGIGWIDIAYRCDAIVCLVSPKSLKTNATRIFDVIDANSFKSIEQFREVNAVAITRHLEHLISEHSSVWFKWNEFGKFLSDQ